MCCKWIYKKIKFGSIYDLELWEAIQVSTCGKPGECFVTDERAGALCSISDVRDVHMATSGTSGQCDLKKQNGGMYKCNLDKNNNVLRYNMV